MKTNRRLILLALLAVLCGQEAQAFYNASTGRWLSRDPIAQKSSVDCYGFIHNRPVGSVDNLGLLEVKHIGQGFKYVPGPPEHFWLGLQARLTPDEASKVGDKGIVLTRVHTRVSISDCCLDDCTTDRDGTMYFLDRFRLAGSELLFGGPSVHSPHPMTDNRNSLIFQPINFNTDALLPCGHLTNNRRPQRATRGEIYVDWSYKLQPYSDYLWSGGAFRPAAPGGYDRVFWPEAADKPFNSYEPVEWSYFSYSEGRYLMKFKWDNCGGSTANFWSSARLEVGPQREGRDVTYPGEIIYR